MSAIVLLSSLTLFNHFSVSLVGLLLASIAGLCIAILIVQRQLGISNEINEQLCSAGGQTDCNAVINAEGSKLSKWLDWADAGIIYFASFLLLLVTSHRSQILSLLSASAIPFVFFSVYYQWRVVKKWCNLCLLTVAVLVIQFALLSPVALSQAKGGGVERFSIKTLLFTAFVFNAIATAWLLVLKPALQKNKELTDKNYSLLRFKNNPDIFNALLQYQRQVDTTPFENDLQLGNPDSPIQIIVACNPYCSPCAKAHKTLHELVEKNDIGVTVRFSIKSDKKGDIRIHTVKYLLQLLTDETNVYKRRAIHDWYLDMDMGKFSQLYPIRNKKDVDVLLELQQQWSDKAKIAFTPTVFINGYELPKQYIANDLKRIIGSVEKATETTKSYLKERNDNIMV